MVTSIELSYKSDYSVAESASSHVTLKSERQNETLELPKLALIGIGIGAIAGFSISAFWYQKYRQRQLYLTAKIDRFIEEFSCGSLADYHLSKSRNFQKNSTTENQEGIPKFTNNQENLVNSNSSLPIDNIVAESTTEAIPNYLCDSYQKLIEEIVTTTLKGEISCQEYIYRKLIENIGTGNGEIFERCLSDRLNSTQSQLNKVKISPELFQRETPELKKARLNRTLKALQSIQSEWERIEKQKRNQAAVTAAVQQILTASEASRFSVLLQIIDPNQNQIFSQNQLQKLAQELKIAVSVDEDFERKQQIEQLAIGIASGVESYQQLEPSLVSWIYEPRKTPLELTQSQPKQEPWASWAQKVSSPLTQILFSTLADGISATEVIVRQSDINIKDWVELTIIVQRIQQSLVNWFERQPYDSQWGTSASIATFLSFAVVWCELSHAFRVATNMHPTKGEELAKACFQIVLQILRTFAHRQYFPLYGGVFALFGRDALQDTINYLDIPLKEVEGTQEKARILTLLGYSQFILGKYPQANSFHHQALEIARQAGDRPCEIANLNHTSRVCVAQKDYSQAIDYSQRALILARQTGQRLGEAHALATLGYSQVFAAQQTERIELDIYQQAIEYLHRGLELSEKLRDSAFGMMAAHQIQALCYTSLGIAHITLEKPQTAIEYLQKGTEAVQFSGDKYLQGLNFLYLAESHYNLNHLEPAVYNSCLGMYLLEQIVAPEWRQAAGLLTILQSKLGNETLEQVIANSRTQIIKFIGVDGYDYLPKLLEEYKRSQ
ncbi:tetratricopeptide repeat protein [Nostoc sp. 2RC]|uniref:tetratricopeptide repeat protein n=1 Tax=Nostoc sp. 2RC TaxID=2485484 RepID=UPI001628216C|nr:tetratricopeptide repeat protein [Nostoc sp. 2RC]MBC1241946.1 tetratricopeptide repeat protein [Nostoc sp. 2RC]